MNKTNLTTKVLSASMAGIILFTSCVSTTMIQSEPSQAKIYLDGQKVGTTPYTMEDTKIVGTCTSVRLEKEGYQNFNTTICRSEEADVGAIVGGIFFLFPFLWTMKYKPVHNYELTPMAPASNENTKSNVNGEKTKAERIMEMKALLDKGVITQEEFDAQKAKILAE